MMMRANFREIRKKSRRLRGERPTTVVSAKRKRKTMIYIDSPYTRSGTMVEKTFLEDVLTDQVEQLSS